MIDYLFCFPDKDTAVAALPQYRTPEWTEDGVTVPAHWDDSVVLRLQIQVGSTPAGTDPDTGAPIETPVYAQGYWLVISLGAINDALYAIPACMREADRNAQAAGKDYVLRQRFTPEQLAADWDLSRQWLGTDYSSD